MPSLRVVKCRQVSSLGPSLCRQCCHLGRQKDFTVVTCVVSLSSLCFGLRSSFEAGMVAGRPWGRVRVMWVASFQSYRQLGWRFMVGRISCDVDWWVTNTITTVVVFDWLANIFEYVALMAIWSCACSASLYQQWAVLVVFVISNASQLPCFNIDRISSQIWIQLHWLQTYLF